MIGIKESENKHLLLVEDNESLKNVMTNFLEDVGFIVRGASTGTNALKISANERVDLILLDVGLPDMDGFEACRRLKEAEHLSDVPVIFVSGRTELKDRLSGFTSGANRYLCKPFTLDELLSEIHYVL